jgi:hypothetical protein
LIVKWIWNRLLSRLDVEMWRMGWWMILLIMGTIAILFVICCVAVFGHKG